MFCAKTDIDNIWAGVAVSQQSLVYGPWNWYFIIVTCHKIVFFWFYFQLFKSVKTKFAPSTKAGGWLDLAGGL